MIGQVNIINKIDSFKTLPHSILLFGERGSEQEDICKHIAERFDLSLFNVTEEISFEMINNILASTVKSLYVVDISKISDREQNMILKLYEEPSIYSYIILICENYSKVLETLVTRSYILNCDLYSDEILSKLCKKETDLALKVCTTPGQIEIANHTNLTELHELCMKIFDKITNAPFYNVLSISNKINFKDEYDKFDLFLFLKMLNYIMLEKLSSNLSINKFNECFKLMLNFNKYVWSMNDKTDGKRKYFENFLTNFYLLYRGV